MPHTKQNEIWFRKKSNRKESYNERVQRDMRTLKWGQASWGQDIIREIPPGEEWFSKLRYHFFQQATKQFLQMVFLWYEDIRSFLSVDKSMNEIEKLNIYI